MSRIYFYKIQRQTLNPHKKLKNDIINIMYQMEIPYMIIDEMNRIESREKQRNKITVNFDLNSKNYSINLFPTTDKMFIEYRGLFLLGKTFQEHKQNLEGVMNNILEENHRDLIMEMEHFGYVPDDNPSFNCLGIVLYKNDNQVLRWFVNDFTTENDVHNLTNSLSFLFNIVPDYIVKKIL
jgi:hypothetical protein